MLPNSVQHLVSKYSMYCILMSDMCCNFPQRIPKGQLAAYQPLHQNVFCLKRNTFFLKNNKENWKCNTLYPLENSPSFSGTYSTEKRQVSTSRNGSLILRIFQDGSSDFLEILWTLAFVSLLLLHCCTAVSRIKTPTMEVRPF